ncbi:MAG TPA: putative toxin-antitoxin system toxin component, PIN family [Usitatibacter sp.]|nr:putative toxin-antitoxin system toxin component, PIN family [Usitatibacter sp.]
MKVVFDSNIYISAFAIPGGLAGQALDAAMDGAFQVAVSRPILDEVLGILARKFARDGEELARVALLVSSLAEMVKPSHRIDLLADEPDNRILECAIAAKADVIVTGDRGMLALGACEGIPILSLREFLDALGPARSAHEPRPAYKAPKRKGVASTSSSIARSRP